jgi:hypothetical protein
MSHLLPLQCTCFPSIPDFGPRRPFCQEPPSPLSSHHAVNPALLQSTVTSLWCCHLEDADCAHLPKTTRNSAHQKGTVLAKMFTCLDYLQADKQMFAAKYFPEQSTECITVEFSRLLWLAWDFWGVCVSVCQFRMDLFFVVFPFFSFIVVLVGVHCGIYKSSYNVSNMSYLRGLEVWLKW